MKKVLYPGSFDPITKGHMNIINQASELFDEVVVAVLNNSSKKNPLFTPKERIRLIKEIYKDQKNIKVISSDQSAVKIAEENNCKAIIRGLRGVADFDYEFQLSTINRKLSSGKVSTICILPNPEYQHISSSVVKELFSLGASISDYVDPLVEKAMINKGKEI